MKKVNIGIVGVGHMGLLHLSNCLHIEDVLVVAAADGSKRALQKARSLGVRNLYSDYRELIDKSKDLDVVIVSLPNFLHFDSIKLALEAGLNVFVEKPMTSTVEESREIVKLVDKTGMKLMVGYNNRFIDAVERMKKVTDEGRIGKLEIVTLELIQNGPLSHGKVPMPISEWWFDPKKSGGGALMDIGCHMIDLFCFFTGGDAEVLFSYLDHKYNLPVEDGATLVLNSKDSSARGIINIGWFEKTIFPKFNYRIILHGNADYISSSDLIPRNIYLYAVKEGMKNLIRRAVGKKIHPLSFTYFYESYYKEMKLFCECIKNDLNSPIPATEGLKTIEIVNEAYKLFNQNFIKEGD